LSKILELLNYNKKREVDKKEGWKNFSNHAPSEYLDDDTKEKLANTYIFKPTNKSKEIIEQQEKKVLPFKHSIETSKIRFAHLFPWLISFLAVLLLLVNIAYRGKISINIEILNEGAIQTASDIRQNPPLQKNLISEITSTDANNISPLSTALITEGELNRNIIKKLGFYGAALSKSKMTQDGLLLFNDGTAGWASVGLDFTEPIDLSNSVLDFFIKGASGTESLELFLRDAESNSYMPQATNVVFNKNMAKDWQFVSIPFNTLKGYYNPKMVNHIGFEFGTQTTSNEPGVSIYIKNIKIVKSKKSQGG